MFATLFLSVLVGSGAEPVILDGGRYSIDNATTPYTMALNSTWYREWGRNGSESDACPVTGDTQVVVFSVATPFGDPLSVALWKSWLALFEWLGFKVSLVGPKHMLDPECGGRLRELGVQVFVMPGGSIMEYAGFTECRDHIQAFLQAGGLYVGSCGGFGYLTSTSDDLKDETEVAFRVKTTYLDVFEKETSPIWHVGKMSPLRNETAADVVEKFGPWEAPRAVLSPLSDGLLAGYAGGAVAAKLPHDAQVLQHFLVDTLPGGEPGHPMASVHVHGHGRNVLGFVYHPEFEWGLPSDEAWDTSLFGRLTLQPGDDHDLPMIQLRMWRSFAEKLLSAMQAADLPVDSQIKIPSTLRYRRFDGIVWKMVEGKNELVPETTVVV